MVKKNTCIFISGKGSNLKNLILKSQNYNFPIKVKLIVSSSTTSLGLRYARKWRVPFFIYDKKFLSEKKLITVLKYYKIELICLAGFMKILNKRFIRSINFKILNIHPSILPKFKGLNTYEKVIKNREKKTGCTVHIVNEKLDSGKKIINKFFYLNKNDNLISIKNKTQKLEYFAYPEAIVSIFRYN